MNQVIRIIFDDNISYDQVKLYAKLIETSFSRVAAIEFYEEEFTDEEDENGQEQREKESK